VNEQLIYNQLLDEVRAAEADLNDKRELVRLWGRRLESLGLMQPQTRTAPAQVKNEEAEGSSLTLVQKVENAVALLSGKEFTVSDVAQTIRDVMLLPLMEKPNTAISTVLQRMEASSTIKRTAKGSGNIPNRYRNAGDPALIPQQQQEGGAADVAP
jgi:hypothetical protein